MTSGKPSEETETSVRIANLRFAYPSPHPSRQRSFTLAVDTWRVAQGSRVGLFGPSGCGKSTLLNLIGGVLQPQQGRITVEGLELSTLTDAEKRAHRIRNIGFIFQDFPLVDYLDVNENVLFPYRLNSALRLDNDARDRARTLLGDLGLEDKAQRRPRFLSSGERQRVAIARALVTQPRLLLADEPTAGLDPDQSLAVVRLLEEVSARQNLTLLMVTHDPSLLELFDDVLAVADYNEELARRVEPSDAA